MKKIVTVLLLVSVLTSSLVFAQGSNETSSSASESKADYAIVLKNQTTDFWVKMKNGVQAEADKLGVSVDIYSAQNEDDLEGQLAIVEMCVANKYKGIGVAPLSGLNVLSGIGKATKSGITVVNIDEMFDNNQLEAQGGAAVAYVATDNVAVGAKGGQFIVDNVLAGAKVLVIEGKSGNQSSEDRANGAKQSLTDGGLNIIGSQAANWDRQTALDVASTYIQQNPDLKGIYCCNDGMALGAIQAVINAKMVGKILVVGTDGDSEAIASIANGQLSATVAQDPALIGATSLDLLIKNTTSGNIGSVGTFPKKTPVSSVLISSENVADFQ